MSDLHIFDVDHTLVKCATGTYFFMEGIKSGLFPFSPLFSIPGMMFKYKLGLLSFENLYTSGVPFISGIAKDKLTRLSVSVFERAIKPRLFPAMGLYIRELLLNKNKVMIASSSFDFIIRPLADYLNIETLLCSSFIFENEICTGKINQPLVYKDSKMDIVLQYLQEQKIKPENVYFYSDSVNDLPLLNAVGKPVVINPDKLLGREAMKLGWPVINRSQLAKPVSIKPFIHF